MYKEENIDEKDNENVEEKDILKFKKDIVNGLEPEPEPEMNEELGDEKTEEEAEELKEENKKQTQLWGRIKMKQM